jgi:alkylated DNA repair dioxygenase AlkB
MTTFLYPTDGAGIAGGALDDTRFEEALPVSGFERGLSVTIARANVRRARAEYVQQNEFVCLDQFLPPRVVDELVTEATRLRSHAQRKHVPLYKKSGSVSYYKLLEHAPRTVELYHAPSFTRFLQDVTGASFTVCPDNDPHACALYYYTEPGDHIGWHYDASHYKGDRFTVLIGLVENSSSRLVCQLFKDDPSRAMEERRIATQPGTVVLFNGNKLYHAVTPLGGAGEERIVLTLEYVTNSAMSPVRRAISNLKDAMTYFGFRELWRASRARSPR